MHLKMPWDGPIYQNKKIYAWFHDLVCVYMYMYMYVCMYMYAADNKHETFNAQIHYNYP